VSVKIYAEGGGTSAGNAECRRGFKKLFEACGFGGRLPRVTACGGRDEAYDDFRNAIAGIPAGDSVFLLVDSEDPVADIDRTWEHLRNRDNWQRPTGASDDDVLLMTTCMETWIVADRAALEEHFGRDLNSNALPPLTDLERRSRHDVFDRLRRATQQCPATYSKGPLSFVVLGKLDPAVLEQHLPSFNRARAILNIRL